MITRNIIFTLFLFHDNFHLGFRGQSFIGSVMQNRSLLLLSTLTVILLSSCSTTNNKYYPVSNKAPRISSLGFYISPPPGRNWYEKHFEDSLFYFKNTKDKNYALTTQATELIFKDTSNVEREIIEYIKSHKQHTDADLRYKNCTFDYRVENIESSVCVRYQHTYNDHGNERKGNNAFVKIFNKGIVCMHPHSPYVGIDVNYMEKSFPEVSPPSFRNEGEQFISSLNFYNTTKY